jgi:hypothetical protein
LLALHHYPSLPLGLAPSDIGSQKTLTRLDYENRLSCTGDDPFRHAAHGQI